MRNLSRKIISITLVLFLFFLTPSKASANWDASISQGLKSSTASTLGSERIDGNGSKIEVQELSLNIGDTYSLKLPALQSSVFSYEIDNDSVLNAQVEASNDLMDNYYNAKLYAISSGQAKLTVMMNNIVTLELQVIVSPSNFLNTSSELDESTITDLTSFAAENGFFGELEWSSEDTDIVEVDSNGLALGVSEGDTKITIKSVETQETYSFKITVNKVEEVVEEVPEQSTTFDPIKPVSGGYISCVYGGYKGHSGIDVAVSTGTKVVAADSGTVILVKHLNYSYGNYIVIEHSGGITTKYAHLSETQVEVGQTVQKGQQIGLSGSTGNSTGPHLHFEILKNGVHQNPGYVFE